MNKRVIILSTLTLVSFKIYAGTITCQNYSSKNIWFNADGMQGVKQSFVKNAPTKLVNIPNIINGKDRTFVKIEKNRQDNATTKSGKRRPYWMIGDGKTIYTTQEDHYENPDCLIIKGDGTEYEMKEAIFGITKKTPTGKNSWTGKAKVIPITQALEKEELEKKSLDKLLNTMIRSEYSESDRLKRETEALSILKTLNIDPNFVPKNGPNGWKEGMGLIHMAAYHLYDKIVKYLIEKNVNINLKAGNNTPLDDALMGAEYYTRPSMASIGQKEKEAIIRSRDLAANILEMIIRAGGAAAREGGTPSSIMTRDFVKAVGKFDTTDLMRKIKQSNNSYCIRLVENLQELFAKPAIPSREGRPSQKPQAGTPATKPSIQTSTKIPPAIPSKEGRPSQKPQAGTPATKPTPVKRNVIEM